MADINITLLQRLGGFLYHVVDAPETALETREEAELLVEQVEVAIAERLPYAVVLHGSRPHVKDPRGRVAVFEKLETAKNAAQLLNDGDMNPVDVMWNEEEK